MKCYAVDIRTPTDRLLTWERYAVDPVALITGVMAAGRQEWPGQEWTITNWIEVTPHADRKGIASIVRCECGRITGVACAWSGPAEATVILEWMPPYLRTSHEATGNRGVYPHNGAERWPLEKTCAMALVDDWTHIVT